MKETVQQFGHKPMAEATLNLFRELNIPVNEVNIAGSLDDFLGDEIRVKESEQVGTVTLVGSVDDKVFANRDSDFDYREVMDEKQKYDGLIILCVELKKTDPTRTFLSNITRALNRSFHTSPVVVLFKYGSHISLANAERMQYKQKWREGEKVGKVSLLRDIRIANPHSGHLRILNDLKLERSGSKKVDSFAVLYEYWQSVFDVSILNKKFYEELSNWYFWAIKHVRFPDEPTAEDAHEQNKDLGDMLQEHRATNVIRLLTRLLFVWFIKEKGLIPEELFDLNTLQKDILKEITPYHETGMFKDANKESVYYKAILQNLFFATLNCPIETSSTDTRQRGFRRPNSNYGVMFLMRYEEYFKDKEVFLELVNNKVPFLNGGLFECLDIRGEKENKEDRVWVDGFSDNLPKEHKLIVPDFLFFGVKEHVDLSEDYGLNSKKYKEADVKGLLNIFDSYKFTITENTPIEEDVALDPELLGKVFENLLASYNPETKTTARKQTGSFYTPREIVNYMVDESLIAYLKNAIEDWGVPEEELDKKLHQLTSYEETVPFDGNEELQRKIITALSNCTILDPACGSGAFPMGILQKMVHILQKLDPDNKVWKEIQEEKAKEEAGRAISEIVDKKERAQRLNEINEAFDVKINAPDYARKLFLIENCIYGVDIQPVATQISKLRFFISLVVEQKVGTDKSENFGIRPLPNLETKFVTANTLIDIEGIGSQGSLSYTKEVEKLHEELRQVRSKLFSARTTETKNKYRLRDEELRHSISKELKKSGMPAESANKLAKWDPYDQNYSSLFFNPEWIFDVDDGFNVVIGNPPYLGQSGNKDVFRIVKNTPFGSKFHQRRMDYFYFFFHRGIELTKEEGVIAYITTNYFFNATYADKLRNHIIDTCQFHKIFDFNEVKVFESAQGQHNCISILKKTNDTLNCSWSYCNRSEIKNETELELVLKGHDKNTTYGQISSDQVFDANQNIDLKFISTLSVSEESNPINLISKKKHKISDFFEINQGIVTGGNKITGRHTKKYNLENHHGEGVFILSGEELKNLGLNEIEKSYVKPWFKNSDVDRYITLNKRDEFIIYYTSFNCIEHSMIPNLVEHFSKYKKLLINRNIRTGSITLKEYEKFIEGSIDVDYVMIKSTFQEGQYFAISYARTQEIFEAPKVVCPQRSNKSCFAYNEEPWYGASDLYFINSPIDDTVELKVLCGILNSKLIYYWLYYKGQRKGDMLQLFKGPLNEIPLIDIRNIKYQFIFEFLVNIMIYSKSNNLPIEVFQSKIDACVFEFYFENHMKSLSIDVLRFIEQDLKKIIQDQNFDDLSDKEKVIEQLHERWSDPENEVRKRINSFPEKSPDILKPILEG